MSNLSPQQQRFWNELTQMRTHIAYLALYELDCERVDRVVKIFLAVAASGSIAAWAVWREFSMLWGSIIAASQFLGAIKEHLPFEKRLKVARDLGGKLEGLFVQWETSWNVVAGGELSEAEINSRLAELKKAKVELVSSCLSASTLPNKPQLHERAAAEAVTYFEIVYARGEHDEQEP